MKKTYHNLTSKDDTILLIKDILKKYYKDVLPYKNWTLQQFYDYVRTYPYKQDESPIEVIYRPKYFRNFPNADCKKKAIMIASFLKIQNIPYRICTSSNRQDRKVHHVFIQFQDSKGQWINIDATYPSYRIGMEKKVTKIIYE